MNERDVPRRRPGQGPDGNYDPYVDSYYESGYEDQTGSGRRPQGGVGGPRGYDRQGAMPADRGGSGPHFYDPAPRPATTAAPACPTSRTKTSMTRSRRTGAAARR